MSTPLSTKAPDPDRPIRLARFFSYPDQVLYLFSSFIGIVALGHFASLVYTFSRRKATLSPVSYTNNTGFSLLYLPKALVNAFRAIVFRWTIPVGRSYTLNIAEVFMTASYAAILFTWSMINSTTTTGIKAEPHYWANRAGTIAASQLPIMTALGMRNNLISLITGVSFDKLIYLHRMSARILCVLVWLHGAGRLKVGLIGDESLINRWVQCGFLAAPALTILCITTLRPIRERSYEIFLLIHFIFSFIFLLGLYYHMKGRHLTFYGVWPSFLLWGLDRLLRLVRIVVFNPKSLKGTASTQTRSESSATIDVLAPDFLRVTLRRPSYFHWLPGQSAYLTFPGVSTSPLEAHPFTISTIDSTSEGQNQELFKHLIFLVRVRKGLTQKLLKHAPGHSSTKVLLDGPYSSPPLLIGFDSVILIAGGSGVAFTLPLLLDLLHRARKGNPRCRRIVFLWATRSISHVKGIVEMLSPALTPGLTSISLDIRFFVTMAAEDAQAWDDGLTVEDTVSDLKANNYVSDAELPNTSIMKVQKGRPNLQLLLNEEISRAAGPISVNVCGTQALASAVRRALRSTRFFKVLRGGPTITLHVEAFGSS